MSATGPSPRRSHLPRLLRRLAVAAGGSLTVLVGVALLVLPGPGWAVIFAGLALLGTEFGWARRARTALTDRAMTLTRRLRPASRPHKSPSTTTTAAGTSPTPRETSSSRP